MLKPVLLIITLIFLFSCSPEKPTKPEDIWEEEEFTEALVQVQLTEAILRLGHRLRKDSIVHPDSIHSATFRKIGHSKQEFEKNFEYYIQDPERMEKIYEEVIVRLSEMEAAIKASKKDSL